MKIKIFIRNNRKVVQLFAIGSTLPSMGIITSVETPALSILAWAKEKIREV